MKNCEYCPYRGRFVTAIDFNVLPGVDCAICCPGDWCSFFAVVITGLFVLMIYRVITSWSRKDEDGSTPHHGPDTSSRKAGQTAAENKNFFLG